MNFRVDNSGRVGASELPSGISGTDLAQLLGWTRSSKGPQDPAAFLQQLGINTDMLQLGTAKGFDSQIASQGRNLDVYSQGPGLDAVSNGKMMHIGHKGAGVKDIQRMLNSMGANLEVDGMFGPKTEAALKSFQAARGGSGSGRLDAASLSQLRQGGDPLTSQQWGKYAPDYTSSRGSIDQDRARVYDDRARPLDKGVIVDDGKPLPKGTKGLLEQIARGEGTSDEKARARGFDSGYDVTLSYGAYTPAEFKGQKVSEMTLGQVKQLQRGMLNHPRNGFNSSAVGKYQIVGTTLRGLQKEMGLSDNAVFTPELQDKMATQLLERRGLSKFQSGQISSSRFQNNLAKEWASVARSDTGRSHYGQGTGTSSAQIQSALNNVG